MEGLVVLNSKLVPLREERFGWACVVSWHPVWSELPAEMCLFIAKYLVEKHEECRICKKYMRRNEMYLSDYGYCTAKCSSDARPKYTFFGHSDMQIGDERFRGVPMMHYTTYFAPVFTNNGILWNTGRREEEEEEEN